jgi:hypothetical protein
MQVAERDRNITILFLVFAASLSAALGCRSAMDDFYWPLVRQDPACSTSSTGAAAGAGGSSGGMSGTAGTGAGCAGGATITASKEPQ